MGLDTLRECVECGREFDGGKNMRIVACSLCKHDRAMRLKTFRDKKRKEKDYKPRKYTRKGGNNAGWKDKTCEDS